MSTVVDEHLDICMLCGEPFVIPECLMGMHEAQLVVGLRCDSCGVRELVVVGAGAFEALVTRQEQPDRPLGRRAAFERQCEQFIAALHADLILPEDF